MTQRSRNATWLPVGALVSGGFERRAEMVLEAMVDRLRVYQRVVSTCWSPISRCPR